MTMTNTPPLCLLSIHAHPDDEASKGAATVAKYVDQGIRAVLVTCTGGEAGEVLNKAMDKPGVLENLPAIRRKELDASVEAIGYHKLYLLGYHDSGMPGTHWNDRPDNFHNAPFEEALEKLVRIIRTERPHVILTYDQQGPMYQHPDHARVHEISEPAFDAAGDPNRFPDTGEPWQPLKMYYGSGRSMRRWEILEPVYEAHGLESPRKRMEQRRKERGRPVDDERPDTTTTLIDIGDYLHRRRAALLAHPSQVDPTEGFWFALPDEVLKEHYPWEEFTLARSLVENRVPEGEMEMDLFAGIR